MIYSIKQQIITYSGIAGVLFFVITTIIGGYVFEGSYSHISQYISESYALGTPYDSLLQWIGYIPSGLLIALFCLMNSRRFKDSVYAAVGFMGFAIFYGLFTSLVSVFPCDLGCNRDYSNSASTSQNIHSVLSVLTYLFTPFSLLLIGKGLNKIKSLKLFSKVSLLMGFAGFGFGLLFLFNANSSIAGLLQRMTEMVYLSWIIYCSIALPPDKPM